MKKRDGWHKISGGKYEYYVEDGKVLRGVCGSGLDQAPVYPYKRCRQGGYYLAVGVKVSTFLSGFYRGIYALK